MTVDENEPILFLLVCVSFLVPLHFPILFFERYDAVFCFPFLVYSVQAEIQ